MKAKILKTGVFDSTHEGTQPELRHPDDFHTDSFLDSLEGVPYISENPRRLLSPVEMKKITLGHIVSAKKLQDHIEIMIQPISWLRSMSNHFRKKVLACGYTCEVVDEEGVYKGDKYVKRQTKIELSHVCFDKHVFGFDLSGGGS